MNENGVHSFPEGISLKVNVISRLEFELADCDVAVQHVNHYITGTLPSVFVYMCMYVIILVCFYPIRGCPHGVMVEAMDCGIVVSEFVLQAR